MTVPPLLKQDFTGTIPLDTEGNRICTARGFQTKDATTVPQGSPLAYSSAVITLKTPTNAVEITLAPTTDLRYSEDPTMATYDIIKAGSKEVIGLYDGDLYIKRDASDGTVAFSYILL